MFFLCIEWLQFQKTKHGGYMIPIVKVYKFIKSIILRNKKFNFFKVDYQRGQDAKLLFTGNLNKKGASHVAISQDSYTLAVTVGDQLHMINALNGQTDQVIDNVCTESISEICFSIDNRYLAIACDRHVKVFFNITGHRVAIYDLKDKLRTAKTEAAKERIHQSIEEHQ